MDRDEYFATLKEQLETGQEVTTALYHDRISAT
jgi:hypothetical protein